MALRDDCRGLESLPLKLMIVAVVASMSILPASNALDHLLVRDLLNKAVLQLDRLISTAKLLAFGGPGGARTVSLDFSSSCRLSFERIVIGDRAGGPNMSAAVIAFSNGATMIRTCEEPSVWMRGENGGGVIIESQRAELRMTSQIGNGSPYILVEEI